MSADPVHAIARALLYEGYLLYPYRPSAIKNQQRFNFGVLYPKGYANASRSNDAFQLQVECPVAGHGETRLDLSLRFLQLTERPLEDRPGGTWHEAVEREFSVEAFTIGGAGGVSHTVFGFPLTGVNPDRPASLHGEAQEEDMICGEMEAAVEEIRAGAYKLSVRVSNLTSIDPTVTDRNEALLRSLVSAHVVLRVADGDLISLVDPPPAFRDITEACANVGVWPVLVGNDGGHDCMLASPIILYDYPQIAPESAGDLFDGTEIDEILALRILTMSDDEKREARDADVHARQILDRTEALSPEHWARLHGAVRGLRKITG